MCSIIALRILIIASFCLDKQCIWACLRCVFGHVAEYVCGGQAGALTKWQNLTQENRACLPSKGSLKHTSNTNRDWEHLGGQRNQREGEEGRDGVNMTEAVNSPQTSTDTHTETVTHWEWLLLEFTALCVLVWSEDDLRVLTGPWRIDGWDSVITGFLLTDLLISQQRLRTDS